MNLEEAELEEQTTIAGSVMVPYLFLNADQVNAAFFGVCPWGLSKLCVEPARLLSQWFFAIVGDRSWGDFFGPVGFC